MELSIIIPARNEEKRIGKTLEYTCDYLQQKKIDYEIIVVDDGSTDDTRVVVKSFNNPRIKLTNKRANRGKGYSVKQGLLLADKKYVLFMDADNSTRIEEIEKFFPCFKDHDLVIASRNLPGSRIDIKQPYFRSLLGKIFPLCVKIFAVRGIKDTQCGFKMFKREVAQKIARLLTVDRFAFDVELLYIAKKFGYSIKEVPVAWYNDTDSRVGLLTPLRMLRSLFKIRLRDLKGGYDEEQLV